MHAITRRLEAERPTDFCLLALPRENIIHVPKRLSLNKFIKNSKQFGIALHKLNAQRALARVEVGQQIGLTQASEMSDLSLTKLKSFSTGYKRNVTAANAPHYIMLPKEHASQLRTSLAEDNIAEVQSTQLADDNLEVGCYEVRAGDTLSGIESGSTLKPLTCRSGIICATRIA